jgi:predicted nicotinamide N-methyase
VVEPVVVGDLVLELLRPRRAEDLIDEEAYARDERLPYWAELWPSGRVLAGALAREPGLAGARVLELGCGLGVPSLVALARGARVLATDWYPEALAFARENCRRALGVELPTLVVDWFGPPPALLAGAPFDLVVAADVLYEGRNAEGLADLLPLLCGPRGALVSDPRRPHARLALDALTARGWAVSTTDVPLRSGVDEAGPVIHLHRLRPPAG